MGLNSVDRFFFGWGLFGTISLIAIWFLPWRFQVNDDEIMMWLVSGVYTGKPESFAVFIHPILSWSFAKLYTMAPTVKWYPAGWFLVMYGAYLGYLRLIWSRGMDRISAHVWSLFTLCLLVHFSFFLQFSIVSAFAISVGFANRFGQDPMGKSSVFRLYFTDFLLLFGYLIRQEVLFLFLAAYLVLYVLIVRNFHLLKRIVLPALILVIGQSVSHVWIIKSDLGEFQRMNTLRSQVFDHPMLQLYKDEYKVSDPDLYHFANGLMDFKRDSELLEDLKVWKEKLDEMRSEKFGAEFLLHSFTFYLRHGRFLTVLMAVFVFFAFVSNWRWGFQVSALLVLGMLVLSPFYLIKVQIYGLVFLVYFSFCLVHSGGGQKMKIHLFSVLGVLFPMLVYHFYSNTRNSQNRQSSDLVMQQILEIKEEGIEEVYLIGSGDTFGGLSFYNPLNFKKMGWPTLLEIGKGGCPASVVAYLVDSTAYIENRAYFSLGVEMQTESDLVLIVSRP